MNLGSEHSWFTCWKLVVDSDFLLEFHGISSPERWGKDSMSWPTYCSTGLKSLPTWIGNSHFWYTPPFKGRIYNTWRIIPLGKWLITMEIVSSLTGIVGPLPNGLTHSMAVQINGG